MKNKKHGYLKIKYKSFSLLTNIVERLCFLTKTIFSEIVFRFDWNIILNVKSNISEKAIKTIFQKELSKNILNIVDCSRGVEQVVKIVQTAENNKYILKLPLMGKELMIFREDFVCNKLKGSQFIPKIIVKNDNYLIESFIEGEISSDFNKNVYIEIGKVVNKIHSIKTKGFGELQNNRRGEHKTLRNHINFLLKRDIPLLKNTNLLSEEKMRLVLEYIKDNISLIDKKESVLLHFDLTKNNILVKNDKLAGIIDFGDASCGPRSYDLARLFIDFKDKFSYFMDGYKYFVDMKEIEYFAVIHLLYIIPWQYENNHQKEALLNLRLFKSLISL